MSIVELMIVVVIIGILAAVSVVSYRKYVGRARLSEATAMLAEFAAKEQIYFLDVGQYAEAHRTTSLSQSANENANEFFPRDPGVSPWDSVRTPTPLGDLPQSWKYLGIRPRWPEAYCTYMVNAGPAQGNPPVVIPGIIGPKLWPSTPNVPWFYAMAACNMSGQAGWPDYVTVLTLTHDSPAIRTQDERN
jgi:type II secretory pathway pseudopilin PulG